MAQDARQRLAALLAADRQAEGNSAEPRSEMGLICARCVTELQVSGTGATVLATRDREGNRDLRRGLVHATDEVSAGLEDLQLKVGEGPCLDTFSSGGPVLIPDLSTETSRWPAFAQGALELGAAAVFSFPLQIGVVRLGSLDCYRDTSGPLPPAQVRNALILAEYATQAVIAELDGHDTEDVSWLADSHTEINHATGMVQVQLDTTTDGALLRLRGHAYSHELSLAEVARQVVARTLRFAPDEETR